MKWIILGVGIAVVGAGAYLLYRSSKAVSIKTEKVDKLTMSKVLQWFKSDEVKSELLKKPNLISVVLRGEELKKHAKNLKQEGQDTVILVGLFNNAKGEIEKGQLFICNSVDQELIDLFGDKDLIVLK